MIDIKHFYNHMDLDNLVLTWPFEEYLFAEKWVLYNPKESQKSSIFHRIYSCPSYTTDSYVSLLKNAKVLDIGCGTGRSTQMLSELSKEVVGIDFSTKSLEKAKSLLSEKDNVSLYVEDASSMHFEEDSFDYVFMLWNTFGNLYTSRDVVLKEAFRVTKPGGQVCLSVLTDDCLPEYLKMLELNNLRVDKITDDYVFLNEGAVSERFSSDKLHKIIHECFPKSEFGSEPAFAYFPPITDIASWGVIHKKL